MLICLHPLIPLHCLYLHFCCAKTNNGPNAPDNRAAPRRAPLKDSAISPISHLLKFTAGITGQLQKVFWSLPVFTKRLSHADLDATGWNKSTWLGLSPAHTSWRVTTEEEVEKRHRGHKRTVVLQAGVWLQASAPCYQTLANTFWA